MSAHTVAFEEAVEIRPSERIKAGDRFTLWVMGAGMLAGLVTYIIYDVVASTQLQPGWFISADVAKPPIYYAAYAAELVLLTVAGMLALLSANLRKLESGYTVRFALFIGAALVMAARGFTAADWASTKLVDGTGPYPMILSLLIFIGARRSNWVVIEKIMFAFAAIFSALSLYRMATLETFTRQEGVAHLQFPLNALFWPAAWIALRGYRRGSIGDRLKFLPVFVFAAGSLFTQTRLNFVMVLALFAIYAVLQRRRREPQAGLWLAMIVTAIWAALFAGVFLRDTRGVDRLQDVTSAFAERIDEDTRTEQVTAFFETVRPQELALGRGSLATWDWDGYEWRGGTDLGYLTLLFYGGVPLFLTYIATHVKPCIATFRRGVEDWRMAGAGVGVLWAIRMFSSSYPGTDITYYVVLFCIGAAISRET
ncbi:MAG: hypothetical protein LAO79_03375 [Acidobacteriia bacterium]|nr:hypothetical protein [Terriglobia bacterium]